jgi:transcription elongation factor Elf1
MRSPGQQGFGEGFVERNDDRDPAPRTDDLRLKRPDCPHCGSRLLVAEQSRFNLNGRIDHFWACDVCGTEFETSIEVKRRAVARSGVR